MKTNQAHPEIVGLSAEENSIDFGEEDTQPSKFQEVLESSQQQSSHRHSQVVDEVYSAATKAFGEEEKREGIFKEEIN